MEFSPQKTIGAMFAGCLTAVGLSAILGFQTFLYFSIFPSDALRYKLWVVWIWFTDAVHTILICATVWWYAIENFSDGEKTRNIFPTAAITVLLTATITLSANAFYGWRIHKLSRQNWWLTGSIILLSLARVAVAIVSIIEMIKMKTFPNFREHFKNVFTVSLLISAATDAFISFARYYYLRNIKDGYSSTQEVMDTVVVFTINDGILPFSLLIATAVCWSLLEDNFIFLGIYIAVSKLYSNSVLATLNLRNWYRHRHTRSRPLGLSIIRTTANDGAHADGVPGANEATPSSIAQKPAQDINHDDTQMEVFIDRHVEYNVGDLLRESAYHSHSTKSGEMTPA